MRTKTKQPKTEDGRYELFLKRFSRFLKEEGKYMFIMRYLFPLGRDTEEFKRILLNDGEKKVLDTYESLGPSYKKLGYLHYYDNIFPIRNKWLSWCKRFCFY